MAINSSKSRTKRRIGLLTSLLLAVAVGLTIWMVAGVSADFTPEAEIILSDYEHEVNADVTSNFQVPAPSVNFQAVATYFPAEWGIAEDADVPDGTEVGSLDAIATLGLAIGSGFCNVTLNPSFDLYEATTEGACTPDDGDMVAGTWNGYDPVCSGQGNGERAICEYPCFLDTLFPTRPIARYYGHAVVTMGVEAAVNFVVFAPGTSLPGGIPDDEDWGYPSITVLNDTGVPNPNPEPSSLADFCTPLVSNNTIFGEVDGVAVRTNPQYGGTYIFRSWSRGLPDADGDGLENGFDTCPYNPNLDGDPRELGTDPDGDAIDSACDPAPTAPCYPGAEGTVTNPGGCDADGYHTRSDNCPMIQNGRDSAGNPIGANNQLDSDDDGIGDLCDNNPSSIDGTMPVETIELPIDIEGPSPGEETPTPTATATATPTPEATETVVATATPTEETATPTQVVGEGCAPVIPGTYNGLVRLNGVPAASGYEVTAVIDGTEWGSAIVSGGRYALDVPQRLPSSEPCFEGGTITFQINGATCEPTEDWASGLHDVDLTCASAPTVVPPTVPPAGTPTVPATPVATPVAPPVTGGGGLGGDQGMPLWAIVVSGWAVLTALAGLGTLSTRIVKR
jgi:hypothetical protein